MEQIIEIEYHPHEIKTAHEIAKRYNVTAETRGTHPDGLVTVRYVGEQTNLEELVQCLKPGDEFEAYLTV